MITVAIEHLLAHLLLATSRFFGWRVLVISKPIVQNDLWRNAQRHDKQEENCRETSYDEMPVQDNLIRGCKYIPFQRDMQLFSRSAFELVMI